MAEGPLVIRNSTEKRFSHARFQRLISTRFVVTPECQCEIRYRLNRAVHKTKHVLVWQRQYYACFPVPASIGLGFGSIKSGKIPYDECQGGHGFLYVLFVMPYFCLPVLPRFLLLVRSALFPDCLKHVDLLAGLPFLRSARSCARSPKLCRLVLAWLFVPRSAQSCSRIF